MNNEIVKVRLENPIEGYEIEAEYRTPKIGEHVAMGGNVGRVQVDCTGARYLVLTPKFKPYDWSKTSGDCLVYLATGALCRLGDANGIKAVGIYEGWQAMMDSSRAPVDESAVNVEYRYFSGQYMNVTKYAAMVNANQYRVLGLKDGYKY